MFLKFEIIWLKIAQGLRLQNYEIISIFLKKSLYITYDIKFFETYMN